MLLADINNMKKAMRNIFARERRSQRIVNLDTLSSIELIKTVCKLDDELKKEQEKHQTLLRAKDKEIENYKSIIEELKSQNSMNKDQEDYSDDNCYNKKQNLTPEVLTESSKSFKSLRKDVDKLYRNLMALIQNDQDSSYFIPLERKLNYLSMLMQESADELEAIRISKKHENALKSKEIELEALNNSPYQ